MTAVVSAETEEGEEGGVGVGGCHVISRLAPIGKVSAIITHISGKVGTLKLKLCSAHLQRHKYPERGQKVPRQ